MELLERPINMKAKHISKKVELNSRIECLAKNSAFISLKDHKPNLQSSLPCRLISPSKSDIGKINKSILDRINHNLRNKLNFKKLREYYRLVQEDRKQKQLCIYKV